MIREIQKNKLEDQKTELIQANKSKDDFLANMSHELKTPLNSINVISDVMMRNRANNLDEKQVKNLEIINKCGKDLLFLINDVLDISKLEAGQIILNNGTIDIKELIRSIYDMFYPQTKVKDIDFVLKIDESLNNIYSDEDRIKQIVKNLLSNALKFTQEGKISLIVKDENENIRILVKDEGIGIPEDKLEHIFDRFKQVDGSTTRKYGGTGLGLAICKELAQLLKGNITVKSELDKGSTFEVVISKNEDLIEGLSILDLKNTNN
jgi:signal transduction histidine kinase